MSFEQVFHKKTFKVRKKDIFFWAKKVNFIHNSLLCQTIAKLSSIWQFSASSIENWD